MPQKIKCDCGCWILKTSMFKHKETYKHSQIMNEILQEQQIENYLQNWY
jgi:hypothetical protein